MKTKWRPVCKRNLLTSNFSKNRSNKPTGLCSICKDCDKKRKHLWTVENRKLMRELKKHGCVICGYCKNYRALDFHHLRDKKFLLSNAGRRSQQALIKEFHKCILLCANCHRELHNPEGEIK